MYADRKHVSPLRRPTRLLSTLRLRRTPPTPHASDVWEAFVAAHDGDPFAALGEIVILLAEAGLLPDEIDRRWSA
jgi:hypothetical protein